MSTHKYYLVPGPVTVPNKYLQLYAKDYGSSKNNQDIDDVSDPNFKLVLASKILMSMIRRLGRRVF